MLMDATTESKITHANLNHEFEPWIQSEIYNFKIVSFVPLVPDVFKIVSSIWNNTSLIKNP